TFPTAGIYRLSISPVGGIFEGLSFGVDPLKLLEVEQWGDIEWYAMGFQGCANLTISATDIPDIKTNIIKFGGCSSLTSVPNMNNWDISKITSMNGIFYGATNFNEPIGNWNTGNV